MDLSTVCREPTESTEFLMNAASLSSNRERELGELVTLESSQWENLWTKHNRPMTESSIQEYVAKLDRASDAHSTRWVAEQAARNGLIDRLLELRPDVPHLHSARAAEYQAKGDEESAAEHREIAIAMLKKQLQELPNDPRDRSQLQTDLASWIIEHHAPMRSTESSTESDEEWSLQKRLRNLIREKKIIGQNALAAAWLVAEVPREAARSLEETADAIKPENEGVGLCLQMIAYRNLGQLEKQQQLSSKLIQWLKQETLPGRLWVLARQTVVLPDDMSKAEFGELLARELFETGFAKLSIAIQQSPDSKDAYTTRAYFSKRFGKWNMAAADLLKAREIDLDDHILSMNAASTLILAGDEQRYRTICHEMFNRFQPTDNHYKASVLIKTCLLLPDTVKLSSLPIDVLRKAAANPNDPNRHYLVANCALYSFRSGDHQAVIKWTDELLMAKSNAHPLGLMVRAMSQHKLGQTEEARATLKRAELLVLPSLRTLGTDAYDGVVPIESAAGHDEQIAETLRREAEKLMAQE